MDPWTNNFFNMTSAHLKMGAGDFNVTGGGDWAIVGPGFKGTLPQGVRRVTSGYDRVWVVGRTYLRGPRDLDNVHRIQDQYTVTPLSRFGTRYKPGRPRKILTRSTGHTIPGTQPGEDPLAFYSALGREMLKFPAPAADRPLLAQLRGVGIGPGLRPTKMQLSADTLRGLRDAVVQGPNTVLTDALRLYFQEFDKHSGYLVTDLGAWGTNYTWRAIGDRLGVGGQRASIATYPFTLLRPHQGSADRLEPLRPAPPQEQTADPGEGVLVAHHVRHRFVPCSQPVEPVPDHQPVPAAHESRRVDRYLRAARQAVASEPAEQLAARTRARTGVPSGLAPV